MTAIFLLKIAKKYKATQSLGKNICSGQKLNQMGAMIEFFPKFLNKVVRITVWLG